jgi:OOP family OmpA-OmpF porin
MFIAFLDRLRGSATQAGVACAALVFLGLALPVRAIELAFPPMAEATASRTEALSSRKLPIGPYADGVLPTQRAEGAVEVVAYRLPLETGSTLELLQTLRGQLVRAGFVVIFECETEACGGFDFRYGLDVLSEPDMHVNLSDFRYLSARRGAVEDLAVLVSRAGQIGFVQVTRVARDAGGLTAPEVTTPLVVADPPKLAADLGQSAATTVAPGLVAGLESGLSMVMADLVFEPGSSSLSTGLYDSVAKLAGWLAADPRRKVMLVGHTDASGGFEANLRLSQLRAESVRQALLSIQGVVPDQVQAEGIGPLAPRATNLTEEGRRQNRRVEVMVTSTELLER